MGIFENLPFMGSGEVKQQEKAEKREREFVKERDIFNASMQDDQAYMYDRETRSDLIRWQQELDDELLKLVQTLLGQSVSDGEVIESGKRLCNEEFIREVVIPQCKPFMSRNLINSNFDEKRILNDLKNTIHDIVDVMSDHFDRYAIDFMTFDLVLR